MTSVEKIKETMKYNNNYDIFISTLAKLSIKNKKKLFGLKEILLNTNNQLTMSNVKLFLGILIEENIIKEIDQKYMINLSLSKMKELIN